MYENYLIPLSEAGVNFTFDKKRVAKKITKKEDIDLLLNLTYKQCQVKSTIMDLCADFGDGPRFNTYDIFTVPAGAFGGLSSSSDKETKEAAGYYTYKDGRPIPNTREPMATDVYHGTSTKKNKAPFTTTVGLWLFNKAFIEPMSDILGYINYSITKKTYGNINDKLSNALLQDHISLKQLKSFIQLGQLWMSMCSSIAGSHTELMFAMQEKIAKKKEEILRRPGMKKALDAGDMIKMKEFENELIKYAQEILKDDASIDMFNSSARSTWDNNFKNMWLCRSGVVGTDDKVTIITSSYIDGMDPKDYSAVADAAVGGPYSKAKKTANGGYLEKATTLAVGHIKVLGEGSDCGTKDYIWVDLNDKNKNEWLYSFVIDGSRLVELTPEVIGKYIGKRVKMRYASLCKSPNSTICEKCAGTLFRRIGFKNIGLGAFIAMSSIKNAAMKAFHSSVINLSYADIPDVFGLN